jgi:hypothetical protein
MAYFTYDVAFDRGLLEPDGQPNRLYHDAAKVNQEVLRLGQSLRYLTSTGVEFIAGTKSTHIPALLKSFDEGDQRLHGALRGVSIENAGDAHCGLVGFFRDDAGNQYFMLTNLLQGPDKTADQCKATFTLRFHPNVKSILRLNRQTGQAEKLAIDPAQGLTVTLEGGTGDLFKYGNGAFAGVE